MGCRCRAAWVLPGMPASDQRHGLFVVHPHIAKGSANGGGGRKWFAAVIRPFRVNVDKAHLGRAQRATALPTLPRGVGELTGLFIAHTVHIRSGSQTSSPGTKTEGTEARNFQRHVTRQNKQVGGEIFCAYFLA